MKKTLYIGLTGFLFLALPAFSLAGGSHHCSYTCSYPPVVVTPPIVPPTTVPVIVPPVSPGQGPANVSPKGAQGTGGVGGTSGSCIQYININGTMQISSCWSYGHPGNWWDIYLPLFTTPHYQPVIFEGKG